MRCRSPQVTWRRERLPWTCRHLFTFMTQSCLSRLSRYSIQGDYYGNGSLTLSNWRPYCGPQNKSNRRAMTMRSFVLLHLLLSSISVSNAGSLRRSLSKADPACEKMLCADGEVCTVEVFQCITTPCPEPAPKCIKDPCLITDCDSLSTCEVDEQGVAACVPLAIACANVRCGEGSKCAETATGPQCLAADSCEFTTCDVNQLCIDNQGSPKCIDDPCMTFKCKENFGCEVVDQDGTAACTPIYTTTQLKCENVRCPFACIDTQDGPECVDDFLDKPPAWYHTLASKFMGTNLKRCSRRITPPKTGSRCAEIPKTCFFGSQDCGDEIGMHPDTRCYCNGQEGDQTWHCKPANCPELPTDFIK